MLVVGFVRSSFAQEAQPKTFASAGEASNALFQAAQKEDEPALEAILGAGKEVTSSSDDVEDKLERERFSQKYQEMHRLVREPDGLRCCTSAQKIGPFRFRWFRRTAHGTSIPTTGIQEILFRRVGENEATAIQVCRALSTARNRGEPVQDDEIIQYTRDLLAASTANSDSGDRSTGIRKPVRSTGTTFELSQRIQVRSPYPAGKTHAA